MDNLDSKVNLHSKSNCRVGKITAKKQAEVIEATQETDSKIEQLK